MPLVDLETRNITVIPPVENVAADAVGYTMNVTWTPNACVDDLTNPLQMMGGYDVFRCLPDASPEWEPALCETGVPDGADVLVASVDDLDAVGWMDETGLSFGVDYCYRVVTRYGDGALSLASEEACGRIRKDVPVMTRASVESTGNADSVLVGWSPPSDLDTVAAPGPYQYVLQGRPFAGLEGEFVDLWTSETQDELDLLDTVFWHIDVNTAEVAWDIPLRCSATGRMWEHPRGIDPFLTLSPDDNRLRLDINQVVPWGVEATSSSGRCPRAQALRSWTRC